MEYVFDRVTSDIPGLDEHIKHVQAFNWSSTSLGPMSSWPQDILQICHLILMDPQPRAVLLGAKDQVLFYNPAYAAVMGDRHPDVLGRPVMEAWAEVSCDQGASSSLAPNQDPC